jgi:type VI secretion system protein ImpG
VAVRDDLFSYYEKELSFLRRMGADFAQRYPKIASRLQLEPNKCEDPHVERLLEGFAFLAARVHLKIDDDFPEVSESLLNLVYPHYVRPLPSMSLVEMQLDPEQGKLAAGMPVKRGSLLYSRPVGGAPCKFATCYDTTLWPVAVTEAQWLTPERLRPPARATDSAFALRLELRCFTEMTFDQITLDTLRFHLNGEGALVATLYELLSSNCVRILVRDPTPNSKRPPVELPLTALRAVGFEENEGMLPYPKRSFLGYRLLQEYFTFPEKFSFFDLSGFERVRAAGFGDRAELVFLFSTFQRPERRHALETGVNAETIKLGCVPVINLFPQVSEPVLLDQRRVEYMVDPDARRRSSIEVFSVDDVVVSAAGAAQTIKFQPFYSHRHGHESASQYFWYATRRPSSWRPDGGSDVYLSFVDLSARVLRPDVDAVTAFLTCFNGNLPSLLPFGNEGGDFELHGGGPIKRILALVKPTSAVQPPLGKPLLWRLISQLSLNYLSIVEGGVDALREILRLHNFADVPSAERQIEGLVNVRSEPAHSRVVNEYGISFARGRLVEVEFDESQFAGGGVFLFASVLERFLGMYVSLNSFSMLTARTQQRRMPLREWGPRSGWKTLL